MSHLIGLVAAAILVASVAPLAARFASRVRLVAEPHPDRWGARATPLLGGVAIVLGVLLPLVILAPLEGAAIAVVLGTVAAFGLGLVDDLRGLRPTTKLAGQLVIASGLALGGVRVEIVEWPPLAFLLTLMWVVGMMNALNLTDNMDGLAAGVAAIAASVLLLMAPLEPAWVRLLAATCAGACVGFLLHNFPPARIYMGDAGSLPLGFVLAALGLVLTNTSASSVGLAVIGPLLALGLPIYDTALVALWRRLEGGPISRGGRDHTSHRLAALGLSERATVLSLYAVAAGLALLGLLAGALGLALLPLLALVVVSLVLFGVFLSEVPTGDVGRKAARRRLVGTARTLIRFGGEIALDVVLATTALFTAYLVRFEGVPTEIWTLLFAQALPIVVPLQIAAFALLGVYRAMWRFVGVADAVAIVRSAFVGTLAAGFLMLYPLGMTGQSRGGLLIDAVLLAGLVAGSRLSLLWLRHWFALRPRAGSRRALIVGANETGELALRVLLRSTDVAYHPVGFLDDDPGKLRRRINGVPVLGRVSELDAVASRERVDLIVLAVEGSAEERERLHAGCVALGIEAREFARSL